MFWIILGISLFFLGILGEAITNDLDWIMLGVLSVIFIFMVGAFFTHITEYDREEILYTYEEELGTNLTSKINDLEILYKDHNNNSKVITFDKANVTIESNTGKMYFIYTYAKKYNDSIFKYSLSDTYENVAIVLK